MRHSRVGNLGISRHICRALDYHCEQHPSFFQEYQCLPFGSRLSFDNVAVDVKKMRLRILPAHDLERELLSVSSLKERWRTDVHPQSWPSVIDVSALRLISQLHDSISMVHYLPEGNQSSRSKFQVLVFKSTTYEPSYLYHELKFLLTNPEHPNIMGPPLHIVTKKSSFGGKRGVCGFLLPYYHEGSIRDKIAFETHLGTMNFERQLHWSQQITSALVHISQKAGTFYSDLRPDNVLFTGSKSGLKNDDKVVLCDFEQRGNWHEWCAPEILYTMYAGNLDPYSESSFHDSNAASDLLTSFSCISEPGNPSTKRRMQNGPHGGNRPWFSLSTDAREKAQVYSLGLLLYCIFEGVSNPMVSLSNAWPYEPHVEFPTFKSTPLKIRDLIYKCTIDAPKWHTCDGEDDLDGKKNSRETSRVIRIGSKLHASERTFTETEGADMQEQVLKTAQRWWVQELQEAAHYFKSEAWLHGHIGMERPSLHEVLDILDSVSADLKRW